MVINRGCSMLWRFGNLFLVLLIDDKYYIFGDVWFVVCVYSWDGVCSGRG